MGDISIISASAGSGKTYRLATVLEEEIEAQRVRPNAILATTFTIKAAAELQERVHNRLLATGRIEDAQLLNAARIGTVNAVCGGLVNDFFFHLGLAPKLQVLDEPAAKEALRRTFSLVVTADEQHQLAGVVSRFEELDWQGDIHRIVALARINNLSPDDLRRHALRSYQSYLALFGESGKNKTNFNLELQKALEKFTAEVSPLLDTTQATSNALLQAKAALNRMRSGLSITWPDWVRLYKMSTGAKSQEQAEWVRQAASAHDRHPDLFFDIERLSKTVFDIAARCVTEYQKYKREWGVMDFIDQEALTLKLLTMPEVKEQLAEELDLILVDEFQDTSQLQLAIFLKLAKIARHSVWVGDQKQSIYGFRDADPTLMDAAIDNILAGNEPETLKKSWRSRPQLVKVTSKVFAEAFSRQGFPSERVHLEAAKEEPDGGLGPAFEHWVLKSKNVSNDARALAAAVKSSLNDQDFLVRDPNNGVVRPLQAGDMAVLCRVNDTCKEVASALESLGVPAILPRTGLRNTLEATTVLIGLRLMVYPRDRLAAAELARILWRPQNGDSWLKELLSVNGIDVFRAIEPVSSLILAGQKMGAAGVMEYFDRTMELLDIRELCLRWGDSKQRMANLEQLRSYALSYVDECFEKGAGCAPAGLVAFFNDLEEDEKAVLSKMDAVKVTTWHSSKGLEWPVVVLFELHKTYPGTVLGVQLVADQKHIDLTNPLAARWIRYWPYPFGKHKAGFLFQERLDNHEAQREANERERRQELRVLYVGWTRARDRVILATRPGRWKKGMLQLLQDGTGKCLLHEPVNGSASWCGETLSIGKREAAPQRKPRRRSSP